MFRRNLVPPICLLLLAALACSIPGFQPQQGVEGETPAGVAGPSPTPLPPLPPTLIEIDPAPGEELPLQGAITLYFDQAMDKASVEAAVQIEPATKSTLEWLDEATLRIQPSEPLQHAREYQVVIGTQARSAAGLAFTEAISLDFLTIGNLEVAQVFPEPGSEEVNPSSPITVVFNRPVVPLQVEGDLPQPLSLSPGAPGKGEWLDTSIFLFRPEIALPGGVTLRANIDESLTDLTGGTLAEPYAWSFTTALPKVDSIQPAPGAYLVPLDTTIVLTFNQPMDQQSVEEALTLNGLEVKAFNGTFTWDETSSELTFTLAGLLSYNTTYEINLAASARSVGGSSLASDYQAIFSTVPRPAIVASSPLGGGQKTVYANVEISFTSQMDEASLLEAAQIEPQIENFGTYWREEQNILAIFGDYQPATNYELTIDETAADPFGTTIGAPFRLAFTTSDLPPQVGFTRFGEALSLTTSGPQQVEVSVRNTSRLDMQLYRLSQQDTFDLLQGSFYGDVAPRGELIRIWSASLPVQRNKSQALKVRLQNTALPSGAYLLFIDIPNDDRGSQARLIVIRQVELVIKSTIEKAFIWAIDLTDGQPLPSAPIQLLDETGKTVAEGTTDADGVLVVSHSLADDPYARLFALSGAPGDALFGLTANTWSDGIQPYNFGIGLDLVQPAFEAYLYTGRPIYRPGQTVHYRGVLRQTSEARYLLPDLANLNVTVRDGMGEIAHTQTLPLSEYGTFNGEFMLSQEAGLGTYIIETDYGSVFFDVAAYRKPEFTVTVEPSVGEVAAGDVLTADLNGEFFFGGPVAGAEVSWMAWTSPFYPPDLLQPIDWFSLAAGYPVFPFGQNIAQGEGVTNSDGSLQITLPTTLEDDRPQRITIEATITDSSGLPVTGRATVILHPASIYLTLKPQRYALRVGDEAVVNLTASDWDGNRVPGQEANLSVERLTWRQIVDDKGHTTWESEATLVNQATRPTGDDGTLLFSFQPEKGGTYRVTATGRDPSGRQASGELTLWVTGQGAGMWRQPPAGRLALVPDQEEYQPGDTARVLVPSPYEGATTALITIERGEVLSHQVLQIEGADSIVEVPIKDLYAPNIYLSVVLIHMQSNEVPAAIAVGMIELPVAAEALALDVTLTPDRSIAAPGETVTYNLEARNAQGQPVQAEFSLALADLAALSLADPNSPTPFEAFYGDQPLRVRTGASLAVSGEAVVEAPAADGIGGGGDGARALEVRREFPDTAYWNASLVTDIHGRAQVSLNLPDSLTTWRMDVRGVTKKTLVGNAAVDIVATKELLIRPVTPRFFTAGDAAGVAAVVHNNSPSDLTVEAELIASGAEITSAPAVSAAVPSAGQVRFDWSLTVQDVEAVDLTFRVSGGGLQDASKPTIGSAQDGALPVRRYTAPDTVATSGSLEQAGELTEAISLPHSYDATQGELRTVLDPSLVAAMNSALDVLENAPYLSTEGVVSRFLPNLAVYRATQELDLDDPSLQARLERTLNDSLQILRSRQRPDGGWGWWSESPSDTYLTAYVLYSLSLAREAGVSIPETTQDNAIQYLLAGIVPPNMLTEPIIKDRQAFVLYALAVANSGDLATARQMAVDRGALSVWARAVLAHTLGLLDPEDEQIPALLSDLNAAAVRSATGVHWEDDAMDRWNMGSSVRTTAHVLQAMIALDSDNALIPGTVRWLITARARDGAWASTHETAWALLALTNWMEDSGTVEADYEYGLSLNGQTIASGSAAPGALAASVEHTTPVAELLADRPNQLAFKRLAGSGTLYYTAHLSVYRPVEDVQATSRGVSVAREYFLYDGECGDVENPCPPAQSATVGDNLLVRLTLVVPSDQYYFAAEDPYPAGAEPIDTQLLTTPSGRAPINIATADLTNSSWGSWWFTNVEFGDDRLTLFADYLPAGTYQYTYLLHATLPGEYRVLPPRAWAVYFPEVFGQGAGRVYTIQPQ